MLIEKVKKFTIQCGFQVVYWVGSHVAIVSLSLGKKVDTFETTKFLLTGFNVSKYKKCFVTLVDIFTNFSKINFNVFIILKALKDSLKSVYEPLQPEYTHSTNAFNVSKK